MTSREAAAAAVTTLQAAEATIISRLSQGVVAVAAALVDTLAVAIAVRSWRNTVETVLFETSDSMKP